MRPERDFRPAAPLSLFTVERFRYQLRPHACYNFPMDDGFPKVTLPQLSTLVMDAPAGDDWLHEIKYDGYRLLCRKYRERSTVSHGGATGGATNFMRSRRA
jgi:hypothetical protein